MDFLEAVNKRTSIRSYKPDVVSAETMQKIIEVAGRAPSWCNKQCWRFVVVDSYVEKKVIGMASGQDNIAKACEEAPCIIVLCANPKESGLKNGMEYYMLDCGLAMENLVLAAQAEGLSTCIIGFFDEKAIKGVLNVPEHCRVVAFTPVGTAKESVHVRSRKKPEDIIFHNTWGKPLNE